MKLFNAETEVRVGVGIGRKLEIGVGEGKTFDAKFEICIEIKKKN